MNEWKDISAQQIRVSQWCADMVKEIDRINRGDK
jgi:hypothetical protein